MEIPASVWSFERKTYTWSSRKSSHSMKSGGFHTDFMKSGGFQVKFGDFTQISPMKSTQNYKSKWFSKNSSVWWMQGGGFHPWNPPDFTLKSGGFHLWNPPKIIKASVSAKTLQFDECRVGAMTKDFMKSTRFHPDFICEIHPNYKSKCFSKNSCLMNAG